MSDLDVTAELYETRMMALYHCVNLLMSADDWVGRKPRGRYERERVDRLKQEIDEAVQRVIEVGITL